MISKVSIMPAAFRAQSAISAKPASDAAENSVTNPIQGEANKTDNDFYVDKKAAEAIKSYNFVADPTEIKVPMSANDYVAKLKANNLKEGADFDIDKFDNDVIINIHKGDKIYKSVRWFDGKEKDNYVGYDEYTYPINSDIKAVRESYNRNGILSERNKIYTNPDAHKDLIPDDISFDTTPEEYIEKVKKQNKNYEISRTETNDEIYTAVYEIDSNGKYERVTSFSKSDNYQSVGRSYAPDKNGHLTREVDIRKCEDGTYELETTEYLEDLELTNTIKY